MRRQVHYPDFSHSHQQELWTLVTSIDPPWFSCFFLFFILSELTRSTVFAFQRVKLPENLFRATAFIQPVVTLRIVS